MRGILRILSCGYIFTVVITTGDSLTEGQFV